MQSWLSFKVDGREVRVERVSTGRTLADYLTASGQGQAGSRVSGNEPWQGGELIGMVDVDAEGRPVYRIVDASLLLVVQAAGRSFVTAAGLCREGGGHPVVATLARHPLLDCDGDGLANVLMSLFEGYHRGADAFADPRSLSEQLDACLGRTTDYPRLRTAALEIFRDKESRAADDAWSEALGEELPESSDLHYVDPDQRRFYRPQTVIEALKLQRQYPKAIWVSGGTDLGEKAWRGEGDWEVLIALDAVSELHTILDTADHEVEIGAAATLSVIAERLGQEFPLLPKMLRRFGSRAVRNRATLGGHLASASPSGDLWPVLMALDARVRLVSMDAERDVPIASFADGEGVTTLRPGELIRSVVVPRATPEALKGSGVHRRLCEAYKSAQRRHLARAMVASAFCVDLDEEGIIRKVILAYSGIADRPLRARDTEKQLLGKPWDERTVIGALQVLDKEIEVTRDDGLASRAYRRQLVITLFQKFFYQYPTLTSSGRELGYIGDMLSRTLAKGDDQITEAEEKKEAAPKPEKESEPKKEGDATSKSSSDPEESS